MMPRPSQCRACGMFEHCMYPGAQDCVAEQESAEMTDITKEGKVPTQQYSTPDGSIWVFANSDGSLFVRTEGPGHEDDYQAQRLHEVLRYYGPLSLYDPRKAMSDLLNKALLEGAEENWNSVSIGLAEWLVDNGYEIRKKDA